MVSREIKPEEISQGALDIAIAKDAVFPTINAKNPVLNDLLQKGLNKDAFIAIYIDGTIKTWGEAIGTPEIKDVINVYTRSDACGAAEVWAKFTGGKKQEDLKGIGVSADPGILEAVKKDPLGIGYNNLNYAFDQSTGKPVEGAAILPIDFNANGKIDDTELIDTKAKAVQAVASGAYPEPPGRLEHLVTKGQPKGVTKDFLVWILNDGQKYLDEVGYVPLAPERLNEQKSKVK
jgi:phosphate transport system substrate-binding protein